MNAPTPRRAVLAILPLVPLLAACTAVGHPYERPDVALPASIGTAGATAKPALPWSEWWREFGDEDLNRLVAKARAGNLDLRAAEARVRAARLAAQRAGSADKIRLDANGSYTRHRPSDTQFSGVSGSFSNGGDPDETLGLSAAASWEPDLWGRVRHSVDALENDADALAEDRLASEVVLVADLTNAWLDLAEADAEAAILRETIDLLEKTRALVKSRFDAGLVTELDVSRTDGDIAITAARLPETDRRRAVAEHRIALLCGEAPGTTGAALKTRAPAAFRDPPEIPVGLPAQLLERRPDLRALERRIEASNARVNLAIADFYPRVSILGSAGTLTVTPSKALNWESRTWSIGPSIDLPILDGGAREFEQLRAEAERDADAAAWVAAITRAMSEVADGMTGVETRRRVRARLRDAVAASQRTVELSEVRYREGLTSNLEVLDAQRALALSRLDLVRAERACLSEIVALCRALGGGWQPGAETPAPASQPPLPAPVPTPVK